MLQNLFTNKNRLILNKSLRSVLQLLFSLGLGIFLIWWGVKGLSPEQQTEVLTAFKTTSYGWIILSMCLGMLSHVSRAIRSQMLLEPITKRPSFGNSLTALMVGYLGNLAFPRLGEVLRCGTLARYEGIPFEKAFGTVLAERVLDLVMLGLLVLTTLLLESATIGSFFMTNVATPFQEKLSNALPENPILSALILVTGLVIFGALLFWLNRTFKKSALYQKIKGVVTGIWDGLLSVKNVSNLPLFITHTFFIWLMYFAMIYCCFFAMEATQQLSPSVGLVVLTMGTFAIIATQGGIGAYPLIVAAVLVLYQVEYNLGYAFGWVAWTGQTALVLIAGFASLIAIPLINKSSLRETADEGR